MLVTASKTEEKKYIIRFVNCKNADKAKLNKSNLKNIDRGKYGMEETENLYINESLCKMLQFLDYKVRRAFKAK